MKPFDPSQLPGPGLIDEEQWRHVDALAASLTPRQALWLSGYFAGLEAARGGAAAEAPATPAAAQVASSSRALTILFGTETGNSATLARIALAEAEALGLKAKVADMANYKLRELAQEQDLLIVASTYGEGDPPQPATGFFEFVEGRKAPRLEGVRFAVLALGDSTYEKFCEAGKRLDRRLDELGAQRLRPRVDCDVDYDEAAAQWTAETLGELATQGREAAASAPVLAAAAARGAAPHGAVHDKRNPFVATLIDNLELTGRGSSKETRHYEISLAGSGLSYEPGDALGVVPRNDPALVQALIGALKLDPSARLPLKEGEIGLRAALETKFEIGVLTPRFIEHWAQLSDVPALRALVGEEAARARAEFSGANHVLDVVRAFPVAGLAAADFAAGLRPLQPRLYSIASSLAANPGEAHLTVSTVRYELRGEPRQGVASSFLAALAPDAELPVYIQSNPHFRLPADDAPIVMVGAGTGVAPFRAFMQEREERGAKGRSWLFFGERNFSSDFLYQLEWQRLLKDKILSRMEVAFSRDRWGKTYVQHRMRENGAELYAWLEEGAHVYVCGDASKLAPDVDAALIEVVAEHGGRSAEAAAAYVRELAAAHRYQRDVY
ncbi:assimilatory sulfite reductase (NADPH) flavoprotein subunit [Methylocella sp.]|uniref:assimilatory sulfite reductase (NADPH) flavoprotein subunit n=1 Tax=Methylocella sp. TaxID=1978226 RepID=UPI003783AA06